VLLKEAFDVKWTNPAAHAALILGTCGLMFAAAGCANWEAKSAGQVPAGDKSVTLKATDADEVLKYIKNQKGKVVVVDCWHCLCDPCQREFPNLVKLHKKYSPDVVCLSVSVGLPAKKYHDKSLQFLQKQGAEFTNFMVGDGETEADKLQDELKFVAVPAVFVFDAQGQKAFEFRDGFYYQDGKKIGELNDNQTYQHVFKTVEKLLKKAGSS
jgi:thiol-disulfide isomerase/thioredoxin